MFDFGIDKIIVVAVLVGLIMGPERLRELRRALPRHVGRIHALYLQGRAQVVDELNELAPDWREYDPRQLHPRRILQDLNAAATASSTTSAGQMRSGGEPGEAGDLPGAAEESPDALPAPADERMREGAGGGWAHRETADAADPEAAIGASPQAAGEPGVGSSSNVVDAASSNGASGPRGGPAPDGP
ncbi:hypothetical protein SAMN04487848_1046 [Microbacterium sp. ru370.1]|uniref:Sec-independent protein translocase subunit TatA/TatB n=1 Tax=unclassified Microbacterium TaxID=2609290 RepID=UPI00088D2594|nr:MULTISPECIES: twin-arginine translocase TatA/TatE family subunit [unclassified Microbacterium]SDO47035.1 hypothetical protein SAMN04487848_1046 [Microbacterium sp. ru370.1]SIT81957.1 hypothetical protein SAMN05880579_1042 [Microbacterium sp. RU1D]